MSTTVHMLRICHRVDGLLRVAALGQWRRSASRHKIRKNRVRENLSCCCYLHIAAIGCCWRSSSTPQLQASRRPRKTRTSAPVSTTPYLAVLAQSVRAAGSNSITYKIGLCACSCARDAVVWSCRVVSAAHEARLIVAVCFMVLIVNGSAGTLSQGLPDDWR